MRKSTNKLKCLVIGLCVLVLMGLMYFCVRMFNKSSRANGKLKIVLSKYKEDVDWVKILKTPYTIYSKIEGENNYIKDIDGTEASTYLYHIIQNYDKLDEWTLFAHAHETHWHHPTSILNSVNIDIDQMKNKGIHFFSINHRVEGDKKPVMVHKDKHKLFPVELTPSEYQTVFKDMFGIEEYNRVCKPGKSIDQQSHPNCAQFFVHRSRILNRPKNFYERCFKILQDEDHLLSRWYDRPNPAYFKKRHIGGFYLEAVWHYIFGEKLLYEPPIANYDDYPMIKSCV